jgi:tagatose-1,6-bisphosphate aldolase
MPIARLWSMPARNVLPAAFRFWELVTYAEGLEDKGADFARLKPDVVTQSMAGFSNARCRVDVMKVGVPVNMDFVEGWPSAGAEILYTKEEVLAHFCRAAGAATIPFIYVSQGVSNETFHYARSRPPWQKQILAQCCAGERLGRTA